MRDQNRFGRLQMRVSRHGIGACCFGAREQRLDPVRNQILQRIDALANEESQIGSNLFVAAASSMQLVTAGANQCGELLLDKVVDVLSLRIVEKFWRRFGAPPPNLSQRFDDFRELFRGKHSSMFESTGMSAAGGEFEGQQPL